ncbi:MAG: hypothetical protein ACRBCT_09440 [Alphaproteobacteria bacterium]
MDDCVTSVGDLQYGALVQGYAEVCCDAMQANRDRFPFKQILGAARDALRSDPVHVVVKGRAAREDYVFCVSAEGIVVRAHGDCPSCECVRSWVADVDYLRAVVEDSEGYVENPARLNWEWLYDA